MKSKAPLVLVEQVIMTLIRDGKTHQIDNAISTGAKDGMLSMDQSVVNLYRAGKITAQTALDYAADPGQMKRKLV